MCIYIYIFSLDCQITFRGALRHALARRESDDLRMMLMILGGCACGRLMCIHRNEAAYAQLWRESGPYRIKLHRRTIRKKQCVLYYMPSMRADGWGRIVQSRRANSGYMMPNTCARARIWWTTYCTFHGNMFHIIIAHCCTFMGNLAWVWRMHQVFFF